ncbi:MAG: heparinase II/III family protein, partial [Gammaproteobacteria bacterium]
GPLGYLSIAAHAHADALAICLAVDGNWLLVDPGTYAYGENPRWRDYFRSTHAHNSIVVDDVSQSGSGGPFLWLRHGNAMLEQTGNQEGRYWVRGSHDGYGNRGVIHRRTVTVCTKAERLEITDLLDGAGSHNAILFFHFAPHVKLTQESNGWLAWRPGITRAARLRLPPEMHWEAVSESMNPISGWYSEALGTKEPIMTLAGRWRGSLPFECTTSVTIESV